MAIAIGLISSLFNSALCTDVSFRQPQQLQCLHHGSTKAHLCSPFLFPYRVGNDSRYVHYGFGARLSAAQAEALLALFFA